MVTFVIQADNTIAQTIFKSLGSKTSFKSHLNSQNDFCKSSNLTAQELNWPRVAQFENSFNNFVISFISLRCVVKSFRVVSASREVDPLLKFFGSSLDFRGAYEPAPPNAKLNSSSTYSLVSKLSVGNKTKLSDFFDTNVFHSNINTITFKTHNDIKR